MLPSPADLPRHYDVRGLRISPNVVLAPMEGVTDLTFRRLIRQIGGAGLTVTEFVASSGVREGSERVMETCAFDPDERPIAVQLYGKDPRTMGEAARVVEAMGVDIIDINMGCPSKKVCAHSGGSALMKEPELARDIVREVVAAVQVPVTVKMRSGFDAARRNAPEIAWICQEEGAQALAIHWRTREDKYSGERQVDKIAEAVQRVAIPVLGNGDVIDIPSAHRMLRETGCAGLMVGRGAIRNPWVLRQISQWLAGEQPVVVDASEKRRAMFGYLEGLRARFGSDKAALGRFKMFAKFYARHLPKGAVLRPYLLRSQTVEEAIDHAEAYFARLVRHEAGDGAAFEGYEGPGAYLRERLAG